MDETYRSPLNRDVRPGAAGEFAPLRIGPLPGLAAGRARARWRG